MKTTVIGLILLASPVHPVVYAACDVPPPPCEALKHATVVMVADIIEAIPPATTSGPSFLLKIPERFRLKVVEGFKGVRLQEREMTPRIPYSSETVVLEAGKRYLLYAQEYRGNWSTSCTRTKLAIQASAEVQQLRQCAK